MLDFLHFAEEASQTSCELAEELSLQHSEHFKCKNEHKMLKKELERAKIQKETHSVQAEEIKRQAANIAQEM